MDDGSLFTPVDGLGLLASYGYKKPQPAPVQGPPMPTDDERRSMDATEVARKGNETEPGRYELVSARDAEKWQKDWREKEASSGILGDAKRLALIGGDSLVAGVREAVRAVPKVGPAIVDGLDAVDRWMTGKGSDEIFADNKKYLEARLTPETQAARKKEFITETKREDGSTRYGLGPAWSDPRSYFSGAVESLPATAATMVPGGVLARGAYMRALAGGLGEKAAAAAAARTALIAGSVSEGIVSGGQTAYEIREQIGALPEEVLKQSQAYQDLLASGKSPSEARASLADDTAVKGLLLAGVATGIFGGQGDRALAKIVAEGVQGGLGKRILAGAGRGAVSEGLLEELPQSVGEKLAENYAMRDADPRRRLTEGVPNAAVSGAIAGGIMGVGFGGAGGAARPQQAGVGEPLADQPMPQSPKGPLRTALDYGAERAGARSIGTGPAAPAATAPVHLPGTGETVMVSMDNGATFPARIESYRDGEAIVADAQTGELLQVPTDALRLPSPEQFAQVSGDDVMAARAAPPAEPPMEMSTEPTTGKTVPAVQTIEGPPDAGKRVIVDQGAAGKVTGRVGGYVADAQTGGLEALVKTDAGEVQVPVSRLAVSAMTKAQIEREEDRINPPAKRDVQTGPTVRQIGKANMELPDDIHARLYDLGKERVESARLLGKGVLDRDRVSAAEQSKLAQQFGIADHELGQIADDYRYRVERSARTAASALPIKMAPVNAKLLDRKRVESARAAEKLARTDDAGATLPADMKSATDGMAHEAATSPKNDTPQPTEAQKEAGNYKKGHVALGGLDVSVENPAGSMRSGTDKSGKPWSIKMKSHYGYIKGTIGKDKDHIDVFIKPGTDAVADGDRVYVIDQVAHDGARRFDEHKVMIGFDSEAAAKKAYAENYTKGWKGLGSITATTLVDFKAWLASGDTTKPFAKNETANIASESDTNIREPVKWFGARDRAQSHIDKKKLGGTHEIVEAAKGRFEVRQKATVKPPLIVETEQPHEKPHSVSTKLKPEAPKKSSWKEIGANSTGYRVFEDERGVRSFVRDGIRTTEPVRLVPNRDGGTDVSINNDDRIANFLTAEEAGGAEPLPDGLPAVGDVVHLRFAGSKAKPTRYTIEKYLMLEGEWVFTARDDRGGRTTDSIKTLVTSKPSATIEKETGPRNAEKIEALFASNKLFTADRVEAARARLRSKLTQLNSGVDPEVLIDGMTIAGAYIESGVRSFADYAKRMIDDFGPKVKPYLLSFWEGSRHFPGIDNAGMTSTEDSKALHDELVADGGLSGANAGDGDADAAPTITSEVQDEDRKYSIASPPPNATPNRMESLARGKEALARLLTSRDPSSIPQWHAMHRHGLGWISFVWEAGPRGELGIAHVMEGRADQAKNASYGNARLTGSALTEFVKETIPSIIVDGKLGRWYLVGGRVRRSLYSAKGTVVLQPVMETSGRAQQISFVATAFPGKGKEMPIVATPITQEQAEKRIREMLADAKGRGTRPYSVATQQRPSADGTPSTWVGPSAALTGSDLGRAGSGSAHAVSDVSIAESGQTGKSVASIRAELAAHPLGSVAAKLIDAGKVRIVESAPSDAPKGAQGWTDGNGIVTLVASAIPEGRAMAVLLHEAFHAGARPLLGEAAWGKLMDGVAPIYRQFERGTGPAKAFFDAARDSVQVAGITDSALAIEEFAAYAIEHAEGAPRSLRVWIDQVIGHVKAWLLRRFVVQAGAVTLGQLRAIAAAAIRAPEATGNTLDVADAQTRYSIGSSSREAAVSQIKGKLTDLTPAMLGAIPLNYFAELKRPNMTAVDDYLSTKRAMDTYRSNKHKRADEIAQEWLSYTRLGFGKDGKAKSAELADLMHASTLAGVDPSASPDAFGEDGLPESYTALRKRFLAMPPKGRAIFEKVRDDYKAQSEEMDALVVANVRRAMEIAAEQAQKDYLKEIERIRNSKTMMPFDKETAIEEARKARASAMQRSEWANKARITRLRAEFETSRLTGPYFPLARFGRYFVALKDVDGEVLSFQRFERAADMNAAVREMHAMAAKEHPGSQVEHGTLDETKNKRGAMDPRLVAKIETILGGASVDPAVMDTIWQRYLETMPEMSIRKRQIHRKGTAGFQKDALRTYASHMFHASHQMARVKFELELQEAVNKAADQARRSDDPVRGSTLANELVKRHDWVMNPEGSALAQHVTSAMFFWYLAASPASAMVNLTQTVIVGLPVLGARLGGISKAAPALMRAASDFISGKGDSRRANLNADDKRAMDAFYETGLIDRTQSHDLAGIGDTGAEYTRPAMIRARIMKYASWMFHQAEVMNREVTALAAYRLARGAGEDHETAVNTAHDLTWKTHFDYSNSNRARFMKSDTAKILAVFQNFQVNMWYRFFRDLHQSLKGETAQARREARYQIAGITGMLALLGGVTSVFGFKAIMALAGLFFDDEDDPRGFEEEFKANIMKMFGSDIGAIILKGAPGTLLNVDLASRVGMADFFVRVPDSNKEGRDAGREMLVALLGATASTALNSYEGMTLVTKGKIARGVEVMAPKFFKDWMQAYRFYNEGLVSQRGNTILERDKMTTWDVFAEGAGFTSARVSETYERNRTLNSMERKVQDERKHLVEAWATARMHDDDDARAKAMERIKEFNARPYARGTIRISQETLTQSLRVRRRNDQRREEGVLIENKALDRFLRSSMPERAYQ